MSLSRHAVCPECGQVHHVRATSIYAPKPAIERCRECVMREAREATRDAQAAAVHAARQLAQDYAPAAELVVHKAVLEVLIRRACDAGDGSKLQDQMRLRAFWDEVRREIER